MYVINVLPYGESRAMLPPKRLISSSTDATLHLAGAAIARQIVLRPLSVTMSRLVNHHIGQLMNVTKARACPITCICPLIDTFSRAIPILFDVLNVHYIRLS